MIEDVVVGLHGASITLKFVVAFAGCRLIWFNLMLYRHPLQQTTKTLIKMSLWASIPVLVIGEIMSRGLNLYFYVGANYFHDPVSTTILFVYLTLSITALLGFLMWINYTAYGLKRGLRIWWIVMGSSVIVGFLTACVSYAIV